MLRPRRVLSELWTLSRFSIVGVAATLTHLGAALMGHDVLSMSIHVANTFGFLIALCVSYLGHYHFTFESLRGHRSALARFLISACVAYAGNAAIVASLQAGTDLSPQICLAAGTAAMPAMTYLLGRFWVY